ncbi:MAG: hypothetical protein OHK0052_26630 [Anaerolineales bacterium]
MRGNYRILTIFAALLGYGCYFALVAPAFAAECALPGWFPEDFKLKDHHIFIAEDRYYLVSIYIGAAGSENRFAYAVSDDFCTWEDLGFILTERTRGAWDEAAIWAPFVLAQGNTYYLFYTGVTRGMAQSIAGG